MKRRFKDEKNENLHAGEFDSNRFSSSKTGMESIRITLMNRSCKN